MQKAIRKSTMADYWRYIDEIVDRMALVEKGGDMHTVAECAKELADKIWSFNSTQPRGRSNRLLVHNRTFVCHMDVPVFLVRVSGTFWAFCHFCGVVAVRPYYNISITTARTTNIFFVQGMADSIFPFRGRNMYSRLFDISSIFRSRYDCLDRLIHG